MKNKALPLIQLCHLSFLIQMNSLALIKVEFYQVILISFLIAVITAVVVATKFFGEDDYLSVTAEKVQKRDIIHKINASGIIQPEEEVQITSMVSGWITEITVVEGDTVNPDKHLISIDQKQYQAAYDQAA